MRHTTARDWLLTALTAAAPFLGIAAVRAITGQAGPAAASAATTEDDPFEPRFDQTIIPTRSALVATGDAATALRIAADSIAVEWNGALFPPPAVADGTTATDPQDGTEPIGSRPAPRPASPGAAAYAEMFRVTSLMEAREGPIAVIDRKLRRIGDDAGSGVIVEAIDLESREVRLRTADGVPLIRRTAR